MTNDTRKKLRESTLKDIITMKEEIDTMYKNVDLNNLTDNDLRDMQSRFSKIWLLIYALRINKD